MPLRSGGNLKSFWSRMQVELLDRKKWNTRLELANAIFEYLEMAQPETSSQPTRMAHTDRVREEPHHHRGTRSNESRLRGTGGRPEPPSDPAHDKQLMRRADRAGITGQRR